MKQLSINPYGESFNIVAKIGENSIIFSPKGDVFVIDCTTPVQREVIQDIQDLYGTIEDTLNSNSSREIPTHIISKLFASESANVYQIRININEDKTLVIDRVAGEMYTEDKNTGINTSMTYLTSNYIKLPFYIKDGKLECNFVPLFKKEAYWRALTTDNAMTRELKEKCDIRANFKVWEEIIDHNYKRLKVKELEGFELQEILEVYKDVISESHVKYLEYISNYVTERDTLVALVNAIGQEALN